MTHRDPFSILLTFWFLFSSYFGSQTSKRAERVLRIDRFALESGKRLFSWRGDGGGSVRLPRLGGEGDAVGLSGKAAEAEGSGDVIPHADAGRRKQGGYVNIQINRHFSPPPPNHCGHSYSSRCSNGKVRVTPVLTHTHTHTSLSTFLLN